ncbi:MAG: PepSY domain-containing protein [Burkholderiales bacterium]|nr:PepSY domain-containing protein [Burkholderiales bacterium]
MARKFFVWLHRWVGLLMAAFLIIVGLTGSLLAFNTDMEKLINPQLFAVKPTPDAKPLDMATLAEKAEAAEPHARVHYFLVGREQVLMHAGPRTDPATGKPYPLDFDQMFLDPWTGKELGHRLNGDWLQGKINLMPFIYELHMNLALGKWGTWVLGIVALAWTIDCFHAVYLTFPVVFSRFFSRWKLAWKIKWPASGYRLNFDLHRASGLWLWPLIFVFAWSSVMFNMGSVYEWTTAKLFDYRTAEQDFASHLLKTPKFDPRLGWHEAQGRAEQLMAQVARGKGFAVNGPIGFGYLPEVGAYTYDVRSSRDISDGEWGGVGIWVDGDTGKLKKTFLPDGEHSGNTVTNWLRALHFANLHGWLAYRILVCLLGLVITMLSVTGIYIWWKKRNARRISRAGRLQTGITVHA